MRIAIVGAGWAGLAAAVTATQAGHSTTVFEASRTLGGRARAMPAALPTGQAVVLDNGQHILIGAYSQTLRLMRTVGVDPEATLLRLPLTLLFPDGDGLALPAWPSPLDALVGIVRAKGWSAGDKWQLLRAALGWQMAKFRCAPPATVADLCQRISPGVMQTFIEPLCVSALNTPADQASGQVFLTVLRDSLFGGPGSSNLLLPTTDLGQLFPEAAARWLAQHGARVQLGARVTQLQGRHQDAGVQWWVNGEPFDAVVWATSAAHAASALVEHAAHTPDAVAQSMRAWVAQAQALHYEAITTVYAWAADARLASPMLALRSNAGAPAQFVFDRGQLCAPVGVQKGVLAFVISASRGERDVLERQVIAQAHAQLGLALTPIQTVVEKRATFACTPHLHRPSHVIAPGLWACGDYTEGPYPATLEGAVRSACVGIQCLTVSAR